MSNVRAAYRQSARPRSAGCERCAQAVIVPDLTYSPSGELLCRRCAAQEQSALADAVLSRRALTPAQAAPLFLVVLPTALLVGMLVVAVAPATSLVGLVVGAVLAARGAHRS